MTDRKSEPNVVELQRTALAAREELIDSLSRLDRRVKHMAGNAANATVASGWGLAAACAWWLSIAIDRPRRRALERDKERLSARQGRGRAVMITALKAAGFVVTGVMLYSAYRRARRLSGGRGAAAPRQLVADLPHPTNGAGSSPADRLPPLEA